MIAWAAATGSLSWPAWLLFGVVFFWQPPHFWALAIKYRDDYRRAGIPMLPVVASVRRVLVESVRVQLADGRGLARGLAVGGPALRRGRDRGRRGVPLRGAPAAAPVPRHGDDGTSGDSLMTMRLFHLSILYLTVVFAAVAAGVFIR